MILPLLRKRRSIRRFKQQEVESQKVESLIEALLRSPSSRGRNPWEFIVIDDRSLLKKVAGAKEHGSSFIAGAPLAIAICADPERCDVWVEDCSIAAIILHLAAESLELGSCWVQIRMRPHDKETSAEEYLREVLDVPERLRIEAVVAVGYPDEEKDGHAVSSLMTEKVHRNRFGQKGHNRA